MALKPITASSRLTLFKKATRTASVLKSLHQQLYCQWPPSCLQRSHIRSLNGLSQRQWRWDSHDLICGYRSTPRDEATPLNTHNKHLQHLLRSGEYGLVLETWEKSKAAGTMDTQSYTIVMELCERLGSSEVAMAVREDMSSQGIAMEASCALHFTTSLMADGLIQETLAFVREHSTLLSDTGFLTQLAHQFLNYSYPKAGLEVCQLTSDSSEPLACVQLECLGSIGQLEAVETFVEAYGDTVPDSVQLARVNALCLASHYNTALEHLSIISTPPSPRTVCLLLEAVRTAEDVSTAVTVFVRHWEQAFTLKESQLAIQFLSLTVTAAHNDRSNHLRRAVNACIHLQGVVLRDSGQPISAELEEFMTFNFPSFLHQQHVFPDQHTYTALLLRLCFDESSLEAADRAIKTLFQAGSPLTSHAFVKWSRHCGPLTPAQANRVLNLIRRHFHARYNIHLSVSDYEELLGVELVCGGEPRQLTAALGYIRTIKATMLSQGLLLEASHWHPLIRALVKLGPVGGALFITYDDMLSQGVEPDLRLYKIIAGGSLGSKQAAQSAVVDWWRLLNSRVRPDVELMNTLIQCCVVCEDYERAFLFFGLFVDCQLQPDWETYQALFEVCCEMRDKDRLVSLASLAETQLPQQVDSVRETIRRIQNCWSDNNHLSET